jgi:hypothetical protein
MRPWSNIALGLGFYLKFNLTNHYVVIFVCVRDKVLS